MKKVQLILAIAAIAFAANAANTYQKVTTAPTDWAGTYLIVCESESVVFNGGADTTKIDAKGTGDAILTTGFTIAEGVLTGSLTVDTATFTIGATDDTTWPWYIKSASGLYLGHKDEDDNGLSTELELKNKCKQALSIDADGNFIAVARYENYGPYNLQYNKKADQLRFRYYTANDKKAIQLYKLVSSPSALSQLTDSPSNRVSKIIKNGRLLIVKDGKEYTIQTCF